MQCSIRPYLHWTVIFLCTTKVKTARTHIESATCLGLFLVGIGHWLPNIHAVFIRFSSLEVLWAYPFLNINIRSENFLPCKIISQFTFENLMYVRNYICLFKQNCDIYLFNIRNKLMLLCIYRLYRISIRIQN